MDVHLSIHLYTVAERVDGSQARDSGGRRWEPERETVEDRVRESAMGWSEGEGNGGGRVARDGSRLTDTEAKKIILDLIDAGHDGALVPLQDGGAKVDVILSQIEGRGHLV